MRTFPVCLFFTFLFLLMVHSRKMNFTIQLNNVTKDRTASFKNDNYMLFPLFLRHGWGESVDAF